MKVMMVLFKISHIRGGKNLFFLNAQKREENNAWSINDDTFLDAIGIFQYNATVRRSKKKILS